MILNSSSVMTRRQSFAGARLEQATAPRKSVPITSLRDSVTDHRIGLTLYKLDKIMNGDIDEILDASSQPTKRQSWQK